MSDIYGLKDVIGCNFCRQFPGAPGYPLKYFSDQRDDPLENEYRVLISQMKKKYPDLHWGWLESCGANAMTNCLGVTVRGRQIIDRLIPTLGPYQQQFPHIITGYLNDPNNWEKMKAIRSNLDPSIIQGNRVPQYYELVARYICNITAHFEWGCSFDQIAEYLRHQFPVQVCEPGHYLAAAGFNPDKSLNVYNSNPRAKGSGINEIRTPKEITKFEKWLIWYEIT